MPLTIEGLSAVWALAAMVVPFSRRSSRPTREFVDGVVAQTDALYRAALRLTRDASEAEDLVQETCLKAFRSWQRFAAGSNLRAWLFTILMNTFRNQRRDAARDLVDVDSEIVERAETRPEQAATPEELLLRDTLDHDLQEALDGLPAVFREAVWLRDVEEFTYAEIAEMLGVPAGTVMSRISRGRRLLYERLTTGERATVSAGRG